MSGPLLMESLLDLQGIKFLLSASVNTFLDVVEQCSKRHHDRVSLDSFSSH